MIRDTGVLRARFVQWDVEPRDAKLNGRSIVLEPVTNGDPADTAPGGGGQTCLSKLSNVSQYNRRNKR